MLDRCHLDTKKKNIEYKIIIHLYKRLRIKKKFDIPTRHVETIQL